ncbi:MAG TPA: hypothetical protein VHB50_00225 [Bryobacteraceae bacterium]|nr:hypothetical protein [Bryobacteraceae bacterium]
MIRIYGLILLFATPAPGARKFYPDDPIVKEPKPLPVGKLRSGKLSDAGDFIHNTFHEPGQKQSRVEPTPSLDVNTIDEVPDSGWYTNRHYFKPMTIEQLVRGADGSKPPAMDEPWTIYQAKLEGVTPGFRIKDSTGERYVIKFDPIENNEMATGADVVGSKFFFALGYNVPDNYPVRFRREQLRLGENIQFNREGHMTIMQPADLDHLLSKAPRYPDGSYRALASRFIPGDVLGPFQYYDTRKDDPNDTVPHERLRVLRGLYVFCSWLDHTDSRAINTLDAIQEIDGVRAVRHYLIDFGAALGSDSLVPKAAWQGHVYTIDFRWGLMEMMTLGLHSADWERMRYRDLPAVGKYDAATFEPDRWKPSYPNPAFDNRTAADCFWAAKQITAFTDDEIRATVAAGKYTNPETIDEITRVLIERRDKIGKYYFAQVLPLDRFIVADGQLTFCDLGGSGRYTISWSHFNNETRAKTRIPGETSFRIPRSDNYLAAELSDGTHRATVYLRLGKVVGVDR